MFGERKQGFLLEKLTNYVYTEKYDKAKEYVLDYFIRLGYPDVGVMMWFPLTNSIQFYTNEQIKKSYLPLLKFKSFNLHQWFFNENTDIYVQDIDHKSPKIYEKNKNKIINLFAGYLHTEKGEYKEKILNKVEVIWDHIRDVWCSSNENQFEYVKFWLAHMIAGRKMQTALYLRSGQGTGKSIISDFLIKKVLGPRIAVATSNPDSILGSFNDQIVSKVLVILEELPCVSAGQWNTYSNHMKHLITGATVEKREKFKNTVQFNNILSFIISTNNNAIKIDTDDRRYVVVDVSNEKVGNREYFNKLSSCTENDKVGEAFYWNCLKIAKKNPKFREWKIPQTISKSELIVENIHSVFVFIKENFLKNANGLDVTFADFYEKYDEYVDNCRLKKVSKVQISRILKEKGIHLVSGTGNKRELIVSYDELWDLYEKYRWIHETDDIIYGEGQEPSETNGDRKVRKYREKEQEKREFENEANALNEKILNYQKQIEKWFEKKEKEERKKRKTKSKILIDFEKGNSVIEEEIEEEEIQEDDVSQVLNLLK